jgi:putative DNA primase/helicase
LRVIDVLNRGGYDPRPTGPGQWESRCPAHNGSRHNLSVKSASGGTVLLKCHHADDSGLSCTPDAIVSALGLKMRDLFPPAGVPIRSARKAQPKGLQRAADRKPPQPSRLFVSPRAAADALARKYGERTGVWVYRDGDGNPIASVYRFDPPGGAKVYRPVSRDAETGRWKISDPPGQWPLYGINEASRAGPVYFVEGEKCADLVRGLGLAAVTTAHGAQSPHKTDLAPLAGRQVVIVPDVGPAGEGYVKNLLGLLGNLDPRPTVKVLRLPGLTGNGDDIEQWLDSRAGSTAEQNRDELEQLTSETPAVELPSPAKPSQHGGDGRPTFPVVRHEGQPEPVEESEAVRPNEAPDDPHRLARLFIERHATHKDGR